MSRIRFIVPAIAALVLTAGGVIACSSSDDSKSPTPQPTAAAVQPTTVPQSTAVPAAAPNTLSTVTIVDFSYAPAEFTAKAGQAVTLNVVNNGASPHTFSIPGVVDSGTLTTGQSKTVTFTPATAGSLQFFCTIHGQAIMSGKLTVQ